MYGVYACAIWMYYTCAQVEGVVNPRGFSPMISSCRAIRFVSVSAAHATKPARKVVSKDTRAKPSPWLDQKSLVLYKNGGWCVV